MLVALGKTLASQCWSAAVRLPEIPSAAPSAAVNFPPLQEEVLSDDLAVWYDGGVSEDVLQGDEEDVADVMRGLFTEEQLLLVTLLGMQLEVLSLIIVLL